VLSADRLVVAPSLPAFRDVARSPGWPAGGGAQSRRSGSPACAQVRTPPPQPPPPRALAHWWPGARWRRPAGRWQARCPARGTLAHPHGLEPARTRAPGGSIVNAVVPAPSTPSTRQRRARVHATLLRFRPLFGPIARPESGARAARQRRWYTPFMHPRQARCACRRGPRRAQRRHLGEAGSAAPSLFREQPRRGPTRARRRYNSAV